MNNCNAYLEHECKVVDNYEDCKFGDFYKPDEDYEYSVCRHLVEGFCHCGEAKKEASEKWLASLLESKGYTLVKS